MRFVQFLTYSNIWIALGAGLLTLQYYLLFELNVDWWIITFSFFSTWLTYTFQRYAKILQKTRLYGPRMQWMIERPIFIKFILISATMGCLITFYWIYEVWKILLPMAILSFFYAWPLPGLKMNLRTIPMIKIFLIGLVWAFVGTWLPNGEFVNHLHLWAYFSAIFLFILAITIPFDIRDKSLDHPNKKTIPQLFGTIASKIIALILLWVSYFILIYLFPDFLWVFICSGFTASVLILYAKEEREELFYSFWVDGLLVLQPILIVLLIQ